MKPQTVAWDANDATWYVLRYASDFRPRTGPGIPPYRSASLDPTLFYDTDRHTLELLPGKPALEAEPLPGLAVDVDGQVYRVDPDTGLILVRCGTSERELVSERGAIGSAAGLALDRRGLLYIADPMAHRVLVVLPDDGSIAGVLVGGLQEPVDVAAAPNGRIYVADRQAGLIVSFNGHFERCGAFAPKDADGVTVTPRPIAVMIDSDGAILVADGNYPRLLRFSPGGMLLGDEEPHALARRADEGRLSLDALQQVYGSTKPRFYAGTCGPCRPERDGGDRLADVHRALRLQQLSLAHAFAPCGTFVSAALDGGTPGTAWHRIEIDADLPEGTWLKVQTVTADDPAALNNPLAILTVTETEDLLTLTAPKFVPFEDANCGVKPRMPSGVPDRLVFSPPGRWLRLRLTLGSDGAATPSVRAIRIYHPRVSYLDLLPRVFRRDPESAFFLEHFLALFEHVFTGVEDRYELFTRQLNPAAAPPDILEWLACLIDLAFDPSWSLEKRRALVEAAMELYATRGTPRGLAHYVEIYTGIRPVIIEAFLERPLRPPFLGLTGAVLGSTTALARVRRGRSVETQFNSRWAHRFSVLVFLQDDCDKDTVGAVVNRIIEVNKPAHTVHTLRMVHPSTWVGMSRVGIDVMLGAREAPATRLGGCGTTDGVDSGSVLGSDSILGEKRPAYARGVGLTL